MTTTILKLVENETPRPALTGEQVMQKVSDLIGEHLPMIPLDDPYRGALGALVCAAPRRRSSTGAGA